MKKNFNKLIKKILKDIQNLDKVYNSDNIFNIEIFNIKILIKKLGSKISRLYSFFKKNNKKSILNFHNIFESIKINFNRLSYLIILNINNNLHSDLLNKSKNIDNFFNKDNFNNYDNFFLQNKKNLKIENKYVLTINSSFNLQTIFFKKKENQELLDYNTLINHYFEKLYCNIEYFNELFHDLSNNSIKVHTKKFSIKKYLFLLFRFILICCGFILIILVL